MQQKDKELDMLSLMAMNRHDRRRIARINRVAKISGSMKPYVKRQEGKGVKEKGDREEKN